MSYFEDQMDAWFDNDCQGHIEDTDVGEIPVSYVEPKPRKKKRKVAPEAKEE